MSREVWDAYDIDGNKLGYDLYRDEADRITQGVYHIVVEIMAVTHDKRVLVTQRDERKPFGCLWEITGGSVLKGESPKIGAMRELREETGIAIDENDLHFVGKIADENCLYYSYIAFISNNPTITLQEGETVDYRFMPYDEFAKFSLTEKFVAHVGRKIHQQAEKISQIIKNNT